MTAPTSALAAIGAAPETGRVAAVLSTRAALAGAADHGPEAVRGHLAAWAGRPVEELLADGVDAFRRGGAARLRYEAWDLIQAHRRRGHAVVLLTPLSVDRVAPVADELGIEHVLATGPEISDGRLTGRVGRSLLGAPAREDALATFAAEHGIDLGASFAYAGSPLEAGLLRAVGHPVALAPDRGLRVLAATNGWPVVEALDRSPGTTGALRTAASYAAFLTATGVGLTAGLAARRRRPGVDAMSRTFARLGPALSGIHIDVRGEEHLRSHRPAVFLINHQSHLVDAIVAFRLLDHNFTVVAKKEVRAVPVLGQATWLADWAYVSRVGDRAEARAAIGDAVAKLEQGISVILAPEGTRSVGPRVGPFKKGAFYMAREAGVPVVPIIIRNSGELMWRDAKTLKPGTVEVVVHPPITCDWTDDEFTDRVEEVRRLYLDTLASWPADSAGTAR